jgi:ribosomal-protein-alanine acetyltransferase
VTLRAATLEDLDAISRIQLASPGAAQWDVTGYLAYRCLVAETDGAVTGFLVSRQTSVDEHEILNLAVLPAARRQGVARQLLTSGLAHGKGLWFLEVRESNRAALRLYESMGFKATGRREAYYYEPPEAAIVMKFVS